jgi:hypothetical protein
LFDLAKLKLVLFPDWAKSGTKKNNT